MQNEITLSQKVLCLFYCFQNPLDKFLLINGRIIAGIISIGSIVRKGFTQSFHDTDIIYNQAIALAFIHTVGTCDGLHKSMRLEWFIEIQARQAFHIKAGEPHSAYKNYPERIFGILEFLVQLTLFHFCPVVFDIKIPLFESLYFVLLLTDDNGHFGFLHPFQLAL